MGSAYFIVLDQSDIDAFVNGKAIARETRRLSRISSSLSLRSLDDFVVIDRDDATSFAEEHGVEVELPDVDTQWFDAQQGLDWVARIGDHIRANPQAVKDADAVLSDLADFERVMTAANQAGARWHLSIDF